MTTLPWTSFILVPLMPLFHFVLVGGVVESPLELHPPR
jgi:hypothetical protein